MDLEFEDIDTQDLIDAVGIEKYSVKELLCISDAEGPEPSVVNEKPNRFGQVVTESELNRRKIERIPENTRRSTRWAVKVWQKWVGFRKDTIETMTGVYKTIRRLSECTAEELDFWLSRFIVEVRNENGDSYPASTLYSLACGLNRHIKEELERVDINIMSKNDNRFANFRSALDSKMKEVTGEGIGTVKKRADPVTTEDEAKLWESGTIGLHSAEALSYAVFLYNCKVFGLRGMNEHVNLQCEQFEFGEDRTGKFVVFNGRLSKNVQGGLNHRKVDVKRVKHYSSPENPKCFVKLLSEYMKCVPESGRFYRKPLPSKQLGDVRFGKQPVGINTLGKYMKSMFAKAGISTEGRNITNHSGKVTCATSLFNQGFDEQLIMARTGHRSLAVRNYKRVSAVLDKQVSEALQPAESENPKKVKLSECSSAAPETSECKEPEISAVGVSSKRQFVIQCKDVKISLDL